MDIEIESNRPPVEVPFATLPEATLVEIIDSFILREGTDYGVHELEHEKKRDQVLEQLKSQKIKLFFDPNTETVTLVPVQSHRLY